MNIRINYPYIAAASSKRHKMPVGWVIVRMTKKGISLDKNNRLRYYFGSSTDFQKSIANVRKWYANVKFPTQGWSDKISVKLDKGESTQDFYLRIKKQYT